jgi:hypothetical protein
MDRQSSIRPIIDDLLSELGVQVIRKAANHKVATAEARMRHGIKDPNRATIMGVQDTVGYNPPVQWCPNLDKDVNASRNLKIDPNK